MGFSVHSDDRMLSLPPLAYLQHVPSRPNFFCDGEALANIADLIYNSPRAGRTSIMHVAFNNIILKSDRD